MNSSKPRNPRNYLRVGPRIHSLQDISLNYEGHNEEVVVRPPDVSRQGMFISTNRKSPEGAVLNLRFRLALTGAEIQTRCEVRYCLTGVGVGVESLDLVQPAEIGVFPFAVLAVQGAARSAAGNIDIIGEIGDVFR